MIECEVEGIMITYLDIMLEKGMVGAYMKRIWPSCVWPFSKDVTKLSRAIVCEAPCRGSLHLITNMIVQVRRRVSCWAENSEKVLKERSGDVLPHVCLPRFFPITCA